MKEKEVEKISGNRWRTAHEDIHHGAEGVALRSATVTVHLIESDTALHAFQQMLSGAVMNALRCFIQLLINSH